MFPLPFSVSFLRACGCAPDPLCRPSSTAYPPFAFSPSAAPSAGSGTASPTLKLCCSSCPHPLPLSLSFSLSLVSSLFRASPPGRFGRLAFRGAYAPHDHAEPLAVVGLRASGAGLAAHGADLELLTKMSHPNIVPIFGTAALPGGGAGGGPWPLLPR